MASVPPEPVPARLRVPKMAELVAGELRRQIVSRDLAGGDALASEADLMTRFGISRPTLREAFRVLESEGLIGVRRGAHGGARVRTPSDDAAARYAGLVLEYRGTTLQDVYEARNIIEPPCAALLARKHTPTDVAELQAHLEGTRSALDDPVAAIRLLNDFHALLVRLSGNQTLGVLSGMLRQIIDRSTARQVHALAGSALNAAALRAGFAEHEKVVELIARGDAARADAVWRRHLDEAQRHTLTGAPASTLLELLE